MHSTTPAPNTLSSIFAGIAIGLLAFIVSISFAALVFVGGFDSYLQSAISIALVSSIIICLGLALFSQFAGVISTVQDAGVVVLAVVAKGMLDRQQGPVGDDSFFTMVVFIGLSALATGLFLYFLGRFRLGNLIRFIPYPVIGGFLGAVGVILIQGAFGIVADYSVDLRNLSPLFESDTLKRWLPTLLFALLLLVATRISHHHMMLPAMLLLGTLLFFMAVLLSSSTPREVQAAGWMLGPFPQTDPWQPIILKDLSQVHWDAILEQVWYIPIVALVSSIVLLLNITAMEVQAQDDIDINAELQRTGAINAILGVLGGFVAYHTISLTLLGWRMNAKNRIAGITCALLLLGVLVFGYNLIAYFPKLVLGGLLLYLAISILWEWLYWGWFKMPVQDYAVMVVILLIVSFVGYLEGMIFGMIAAAILFTFNYSRIDVVGQQLTGDLYQSKVGRPQSLRDHLDVVGKSIDIYHLKGYIFFGSANSLLERVVARLRDESLPSLRFLVMDFRQVQSLDSSAAYAFIRLHQWLEKAGAILVFTELSEDIRQRLDRSEFDLNATPTVRFFPDSDTAIEWCEDRLLEEQRPPEQPLPISFQEQMQAWFPDAEAQQKIFSYLQRQEVAAGEQLAAQGEHSRALYWIDRGRLEAFLVSKGRHRRVRSVQAGAIIGEVALYAHEGRSASIIAAEDSVVYVISEDALARMEAENPSIAMRFHRIIAYVLAKRLADTTNTLRHFI